MLLAVLYGIQEQPEKANGYYRKALQIDPDFAPAMNNLAWNYAEHGGDLDRAVRLAEKARALMPTHPDMADTLGWVYYKKGWYGKAIRPLRDSVEAQPNNPLAHYHLGMAYYKSGNTTLAQAALQHALRLSQDFPGAQEARHILTQLR